MRLDPSGVPLGGVDAQQDRVVLLQTADRADLGNAAVRIGVQVGQIEVHHPGFDPGLQFRDRQLSCISGARADGEHQNPGGGTGMPRPHRVQRPGCRAHDPRVISRAARVCHAGREQRQRDVHRARVHRRIPDLGVPAPELAHVAKQRRERNAATLRQHLREHDRRQRRRGPGEGLEDAAGSAAVGRQQHGQGDEAYGGQIGDSRMLHGAQIEAQFQVARRFQHDAERDAGDRMAGLPAPEGECGADEEGRHDHRSAASPCSIFPGRN